MFQDVGGFSRALYFSRFLFLFTFYTLIERAQLSAGTGSQPISALSVVRVNQRQSTHAKQKVKNKRFRGSSLDFVVG